MRTWSPKLVLRSCHRPALWLLGLIPLTSVASALPCTDKPAAWSLPLDRRVELTGRAGEADFDGVPATLTIVCEPISHRLTLSLTTDDLDISGALLWLAASSVSVLSSEPLLAWKVDDSEEMGIQEVEVSLRSSRHSSEAPSWIWARSDGAPLPIPVWAKEGSVRLSVDDPTIGHVRLQGESLSGRPVNYQAEISPLQPAPDSSNNPKLTTVPPTDRPDLFPREQMPPAMRLRDEAEELLRGGKYEGAANRFEAALELYRLEARLARHEGARHGAWISQVMILVPLVRCYLELERYGQIRQRLELWLELHSRLEDAGYRGTTFHKAPSDADFLPLVLETWLQRLPTDAQRVAAFEQTAEFFEHLVFAHLALGRHELALEGAELARGRAYAALLADRDDHPGGTEPMSVRRIRDVVARRGSTTVEYFLAENLLVIWVVQPEGEIHHRLVPIEREWLAHQIDRLVQALQANRREDEDGIAQRLIDLYQVLVAPIDDLLPKSTEEVVTWIPHHELFRVPFAALRADAHPMSALLYRWPSSYSTSIAILELLANRRPETRARSLLALVDPRPLPEEQSPLTHSGLFRAAISKLAPPGSQYLTGKDASECALHRLAARHSVILLGTHGFAARPEDPSTAVMLGRCSGGDGYLTPAEIARLELDAEWVGLVSCESGRGASGADGVQSMARAFLAAGAQSLTSTLWQVPADTLRAMLEMLEGWLDGGQSKARALQLAQQSADRRHPDQPGMWSGLILAGNP